MGPRVTDLDRRVRAGLASYKEAEDVFRLRGDSDRVQALKWAATLFRALPEAYVQGAGGPGQCFAAAYREARFAKFEDDDLHASPCFCSATDLERSLVDRAGGDDPEGALKALQWYRQYIRGGLIVTGDRIV